MRESFYRPDLVKVALSGGSLKELKKVADVKPPPFVAIVDTPKSIDKSDAVITLKISDAGGGIGDIRLYLNGSAVMLDSTRGVKIVASNQNEIYKTYKLKFSNGLNLIRAIAFNADNTMQSTDAIHEIIASYKSIGMDWSPASTITMFHPVNRQVTRIIIEIFDNDSVLVHPILPISTKLRI